MSGDTCKVLQLVGLFLAAGVAEAFYYVFHELASTRERQPSGVGKVADPSIISGQSDPEGLPGGPDTEREESVRRRSSTGGERPLLPTRAFP